MNIMILIFYTFVTDQSHKGIKCRRDYYARYIFSGLAAHETDETVFISLKNLRPTARSFYTINSTSEVRFTGVFKDTKARYMEIKKSKQAFWVTPGIELTTRNISHRKKAHQQYKSFILGYAEGVRVRFTVIILNFSLVKTFKIA